MAGFAWVTQSCLYPPNLSRFALEAGAGSRGGFLNSNMHYMPWGPPCALCAAPVAQSGIIPCGKPCSPSSGVCTCQSCWETVPGRSWWLSCSLLTPFSYDTWVHANEIDAEIEDPPIPEKPWKVGLAPSFPEFPCWGSGVWALLWLFLPSLCYPDSVLCVLLSCRGTAAQAE